MPIEVHLGGGLSFRPTLELFDALEASDATSVVVTDVGDPVLTRTRFDLGGGTLTVDAFDYQNDASDRTSFFYYPAGGGSMVLRVEGLLDLEGGWGLIPAFRDGSFPRFDGYVGSSAGRIDAFGTEDRLHGQGVLSGGGGDDALTLEGVTSSDRGDGGRSEAIGGSGNDVLETYLADSVMRGGDGDDLIATYAGRAVLAGGAGSDSFVFNNGNSDFSDDATSDSPIRARIRDFDGAEDQLILSILVSRVLPPEAELVSLAALFGPGTLGDLDQFTLGDATHGAFRFSVGQTAGGDAVLTRRGSQDYTGTNTKSYDERIVLQDLSPDQVSLDRVFIDDIFA
jgi:hypothetical protein